MAQSKIRVLVVEDSRITRELLLYILNNDPRIDVIGVAVDGREAIAMAQSEKPDVITMDINLPKLNGYDATRTIMETTPTPIVIVSSSIASKEVSDTFQALSAGALMALPKPTALDHPEHKVLAAELVDAVKLMSEVKVVRRLSKYQRPQPERVQKSSAPMLSRQPRAVAIGASTGGPVVLQKILSALSADFPMPIFVVQHMAAGFIHGMAQWLDGICALSVRVAVNHEVPIAGNVYLAPDGVQFGLAADGSISLREQASHNGYCPSVSYLFASIAEVYGNAAVGVLLTGMGNDGAAGLKQLKECGAVTIAQNEESSVVFGMPNEAIKLGAADQILSPEKIGLLLQGLITNRMYSQ